MLLHNTKGIFLHKLDYSETSIIAKIYTEKFGLQSYLIKGAKGKKSKIKANLLQHLSLLDMVVYHKENASLQTIKELRVDYHFNELHYNIVKSSITIFINEVLYRVIKEEEKNLRLFEFLFNAIQFLDITEENINNFHLLFLLKLTQFLGFYPHGYYSSQTPYFNMMEGKFKKDMSLHSYTLNKAESEVLSMLKNISFENSDLIKFNSSVRNTMLDNLLVFYKLHVPDLPKIKSLDVLHMVFQ